MIYAIQDNKKIPLGTQFDNSWEVEYDRDLSSQLANRKEWTATEDCWFQYHSIFYSQPSATSSNSNVTLTIQLNDIVVANTDNILDSSGGTLYEITASVLMKKGDVISYKNTVDGIQAPPFTAKCGKIFPIHRILSKDEGPVEVTVTADMPGKTSKTAVTAYPLGNNLYIIPYINFTYTPTTTNYATFNVSVSGYKVHNFLLSAWQSSIGAANWGDRTDPRNDYWTVSVYAANTSNNIELRGSIILERKS